MKSKDDDEEDVAKERVRKAIEEGPDLKERSNTVLGNVEVRARWKRSKEI